MDSKEKVMQRMVVVVRTSIIGIIANLFLTGFKAFVGYITGSIAIAMDALNNLSDALSSVITIVGTRLAAKAPDKKHPYGHGRVEYITTSIISIIIMYAGATAFVESIKKILNPSAPEYNGISLAIVTVAIFVKIILGLYVAAAGKKVKSDALVASGKDALFDAVISVATLVAALVFIFTKVSLEAYLGALISLYIVKAGFDMIRDSISQILGERAETELTISMKKTICELEEVRGVYDLTLNNYGPDTYMASLHVEVDSKMSAVDIDHLSRKIFNLVYEEYQVIVSAVGIYAYNCDDPETEKILEDLRNRLEKYPNAIQLHGFYLNKEEKTMSFDVVIDFDAKDRMAVYREIKEEVRGAYPEYQVFVAMDEDISD